MNAALRPFRHSNYFVKALKLGRVYFSSLF